MRRLLNNLELLEPRPELPTIPMEDGKFPVTLNMGIVGEPESDPQALFARGGAGVVAWTSLKRFQEKPAAVVPSTNYFSDSRTILTREGDVYLVVPLQAEKDPSPSFWVGKGKPGQELSEKGILKGTFHQREFNLTLAPGGVVYLIASQREPSMEDGHVGLWKISGDFPPDPILTPWLDRSTEPPQALFLEAGKVEVAWDRNGAIFVETFTLPGK